MVAAEDERGALRHDLRDERRESRAGLEDLGEEAGSLVGDRKRLRLGGRHVAAVGDPEAEG